MIKFFRKIRYDLMEKNKTGKYLKYAIGEIILVVIGILIALQINTWNQHRIAKAKEFSLYKKILVDLENEDKILDTAMITYKRHLDSYDHIFKETIGEASYDSNSFIYNDLRWNNIYDLTVTNKHKAYYSEISNDKIIELLNEKINQEVKLLQANNSFNIFKNEKAKSFLEKHGILDSEAIFKIEKYKFLPFFETNIMLYDKIKLQYGTIEFDQLLANLRVKTSWAISNLEILMRKNNEVKTALKEELLRN